MFKFYSKRPQKGTGLCCKPDAMSVKRKNITASQVTILLIFLVLFTSACRNEEQGSERKPEIQFDEMKWNTMHEGNYPYRKQMINDLMKNYVWAGITQDSVIRMLGKPDEIEEGNLRYDYQKKPFLGGIGTKIEALVFELSPDNTVSLLRFNDGGWD